MRNLFFLLLLLSCVGVAQAQKKKGRPTPSTPTTARKALSADAYDHWKTIPERQLSPDGRWVGYVVNPQEGDGRVVMQGLQGNRLDSVARGAEVKFSFDSDYAVFKIKPQLAATKTAKRAKKKKDALPKDSLGIYRLADGSLSKVPNVLTFKLPEKAGTWLAYQHDSGLGKKPEAKKDTAAVKALERPKSPPVPKDSAELALAKKDTIAPKRSGRGKPKEESEENGFRLTVRRLSGGAERAFAFVTEYEWAKNGKRLAFATTGSDSTLKLPGVYVWESETDQLRKIYEAKGSSKNLTFDEAGEQLAFVADPDTNAKAQIHYYTLHHWQTSRETADKLADQSNQPGPGGWLVSGDAPLKFSKNGAKLFFGTAPRLAVPDTTLLPEEVVNVEVWNWQDKRLQPQQKVTLEKDKKKSYLAVANLSDKRLLQLGTLAVPDVQLANEGNAAFVLATSEEPYSHRHWDWSGYSDAYLISTADGSVTTVAQKIKTGGGDVKVSPDARYLTWFSLPDTTWVIYNVATRTTTPLPRATRFADEDDDHPDYPSPYGTAGWTTHDDRLLVYDKFDLWSVDPLNPAQPRNLTNRRADRTEYRYVRLDPDERVIDASKPLLLRSVHHGTKRSGYASLLLATGQVTPRLEGDYAVSPLVWKAKNSDAVVFTRQTFREFPDLYATDLTFKSVRKLSDANPQQAGYLWGSVELVAWKAGDGTNLEGLLYKPENFDSGKKYPMMVYFYEKYSDALHNHVAPSPVSSNSNYTYYTSNGYVVFVPDIVYQIGYPGKSAYNCVVPGVLKLIEKGFVDRDRIGISGHSWGGYQAAYLITQTNLFRAAETGAPVANMTSAYGGIRWETGLSRQAQYERTQTRIGGTLWEKPMQYIENSPLFFVPNVQTPVLVMHNDEDGAVPWYQGIEFFMALKRLGKPVWMVNYNGEKHGLTQRKNRKDFSLRMYQFFDHYLKGAPAPAWMTSGLPMLEKGINQHYELPGVAPSGK